MTARANLVIPQGGTFRFVVQVVGGPSDLTGYTGEMQVRQTKVSEQVLADTEGYWTVNPGTRQMVLEVPDEATALYEWDNPAVYDAYLVGPTDDRWRVLEGTAILSKTVTREED